MYLGRKNFANQINAFKLLAQGYAFEEKDDETRDFLRKVIIEAHGVLTKKITEKDLSFETYDIVTTMIDNERTFIREYLSKLDPNNLTDEDYKTLFNVLGSIISDLER